MVFVIAVLYGFGAFAIWSTSDLSLGKLRTRDKWFLAFWPFVTLWACIAAAFDMFEAT